MKMNLSRKFEQVETNRQLNINRKYSKMIQDLIAEANDYEDSDVVGPWAIEDPIKQERVINARRELERLGIDY